MFREIDGTPKIQKFKKVIPEQHREEKGDGCNYYLTVMATITGTFSDTHRPIYEPKAENVLFLTGLIVRMRGQYEGRKSNLDIGFVCKSHSEKNRDNWIIYQKCD